MVAKSILIITNDLFDVLYLLEMVGRFFHTCSNVVSIVPNLSGNHFLYDSSRSACSKKAHTETCRRDFDSPRPFANPHRPNPLLSSFERRFDQQKKEMYRYERSIRNVGQVLGYTSGFCKGIWRE